MEHKNSTPKNVHFILYFSLNGEHKNLLLQQFQVATQLEPYIRTLTPAQSSGLGLTLSSQDSSQHLGSQGEQAQQLASLLEHIGK